MVRSPIPAFGMSLLCILGGGIAFMKKSSMPSLIAGVTVGMLYLFSGAQIADGRRSGLQGALAASALLTASSLPRITKGPIPKLLAMSSAVVGFYYARKLFLE
ncbi:hypothetical protein GGX14DRAFT_450557 [Mycena pura]|uniref:Uncharacterized protein n=1 Tax=Mycena pura TaxID=153505 RepID=A0AAD6VI82_9AGAR|nr:hypothetical protein GGX14DRAFT_450557 [Mycena pura]